MGYAVRAFEETPGEPRRPVVGLRVASRQVTAADLIRQWVDVTLANLAGPPPVDTSARAAHPDEAMLHADRLRRRRMAPPPPTAAVAKERALRAFARGRFVLLVDDRQIADEAARIGLTDDSEVTFLRLVPLVGG